MNEILMLKHRRVVFVYLLVALFLPALTTLVSEHILVGIETGMIADIQRNLWIRDLYILPMLIIFMTSQSFNDDKRHGLIREAIVQEVPRNDILKGKCLVLGMLSLCSISLAVFPALLYPSNEPLGATLLSIPLVWLADMLLISLVGTLSLYVSSTGLVVVGLLQWSALEIAVRAFFWVGPNMFELPWIETIGEYTTPLLITSVMDNWTVWEDVWNPTQGLILCVYSVLSLILLHKIWKNHHF